MRRLRVLPPFRSMGLGGFVDLTQRAELRQELHLTTELRQGIQILQMSALDLSEHVQQCVEENPFLDDGDWDWPQHPFSPDEFSRTVSSDSIAPEASDWHDDGAESDPTLTASEARFTSGGCEPAYRDEPAGGGLSVMKLSSADISLTMIRSPRISSSSSSFKASRRACAHCASTSSETSTKADI